MPKISDARREQRRAAIHSAAERCFAANGFQATSMADIVAEAGVSLGGIYRYFPSKEAIIQSVARERHVVEMSLLDNALAAEDPAAAFEIAAGLFENLLTDPAERERRAIVVHLWGEALRNDAVHTTVVDGVSEPVSRLAQYVEAHVDLPSSVTPVALARVFVSMVLGLIAQQAWEPDLDVGDYTAAAVALGTGILGDAPRHRRA